MVSEECKSKLFRKLILIAFALSGMTALIYEIVWSRPLELIFGSTVYAVSTILTTFIFGFAFGSYLFRNIADKTKNPLFLFGVLEMGIGLYGLIILELFKILPNIYISLLYAFGNQFTQFLIMFVILIIPATLFGATWPVLSKVYIDFNRIKNSVKDNNVNGTKGNNVNSTGKSISELYAFNSLGSFIGSLTAGFLLMFLLGLRMTSLFASFVNLLIAVLVFVYSWGKNEY